MTVNNRRAVRPGAIQTPATGSTVAIYASIRKALLDYVTPGGARLQDYVGDPPRVWVGSQPEPPVFPYLTLLLDRTSDASYNGYRETAVLEVQAIGKPESQRPLVETAMDIVDQCLTAYTQTGDGLIVIRSRTRQTVPMFTDPAEAATVGVVAQYVLYLWPSVLTSRRS